MVAGALALASTVFVTPPASAATTIFSDDFAAGIGPGWTNQLWVGGGGVATSQAHVVGGWSSLLRSVDTSDHQNVELSFDYNISGLSAAQELQVTARPNGGSQFTNVVTLQADSGGWKTWTGSIAAQADFASAFQLQFALVQTPAGQPPSGWVVQIDNVLLTGDLDTTPPTATLVGPAPLSEIWQAVTATWEATLSDDFTAAEEISARHVFRSVADPSLERTTSFSTRPGGVISNDLNGNYVRQDLNLVSGDLFQWFVEARDEAGNTALVPMGTYIYRSGNGSPTITSDPPPNGVVGEWYAHLFTATGIAPITWEPAPGNGPLLPPGLTLNPNGGFTGFPTTAGTYTFEIRPTNGVLPWPVQEYTVVISPVSVPVPPSITSGALPDGRQFQAYSFTVTAEGDDPLAFSATGLPGGLSIDPASGVISGMPSAAGSYVVEVTVSNGVAPDAVVSYPVEIAAAIFITAWPPPDGTVGEEFSFPVTATGPGTLAWSAAGLPGGLSIDPSTGVISGTPAAEGSYDISVTVTNGGISVPVSAFATLVITPAATTTTPTTTTTDPTTTETTTTTTDPTTTTTDPTTTDPTTTETTTTTTETTTTTSTTTTDPTTTSTETTTDPTTTSTTTTTEPTTTTSTTDPTTSTETTTTTPTTDTTEPTTSTETTTTAPTTGTTEPTTDLTEPTSTTEPTDTTEPPTTTAQPAPTTDSPAPTITAAPTTWSTISPAPTTWTSPPSPPASGKLPSTGVAPGAALALAALLIIAGALLVGSRLHRRSAHR